MNLIPNRASSSDAMDTRLVLREVLVDVCIRRETHRFLIICFWRKRHLSYPRKTWQVRQLQSLLDTSWRASRKQYSWAFVVMGSKIRRPPCSWKRSTSFWRKACIHHPTQVWKMIHELDNRQDCIRRNKTQVLTKVARMRIYVMSSIFWSFCLDSIKNIDEHRWWQRTHYYLKHSSCQREWHDSLEQRAFQTMSRSSLLF